MAEQEGVHRGVRSGLRWGRLFGRSLPYETETSLFILVSVLDLLMTSVLLYTGKARESNPVANYFLAHWGIKGLVAFKFAMVAFICVLAQVIALRRPETARWLLIFATVVVGAVVVYSVRLYVTVGEVF